MPIRLFCPWNFSKQGTCMPSPSPRLTGFPVTITLHSLHSSARRKYNIAFANLPLHPSGKCPTTTLFFLTATAYLSAELTVSISPQSSSWRKGVQIFWYSWYPWIYEGVSRLTSKTIRIVSSSLISVKAACRVRVAYLKE